MVDKVAAIVITYNRLNLLKEVLNGIRRQTRKVDEIIVVNLETMEVEKQIALGGTRSLSGLTCQLR